MARPRKSKKPDVGQRRIACITHVVDRTLNRMFVWSCSTVSGAHLGGLHRINAMPNPRDRENAMAAVSNLLRNGEAPWSIWLCLFGEEPDGAIWTRSEVLTFEAANVDLVSEFVDKAIESAIEVNENAHPDEVAKGYGWVAIPCGELDLDKCEEKLVEFFIERDVLNEAKRHEIWSEFNNSGKGLDEFIPTSKIKSSIEHVIKSAWL